MQIMLIDRLTQRAKAVLLKLPEKEAISSAKVLVAITEENGMGNTILQSLGIHNLNKRKMVSLNDLTREAFVQAANFEHMYVGTEHLILALFKMCDSPDFNRLRFELIKLSVFPNTVKSIDKNKKTPILDTFGENLNQKTVRNMDKPLVYRTVYESLVASLLLKNTPNVLILGEPGVGKRALVELLARNISSLDVPPALVGYQVIEFDMLAFMTSLMNKSGVETGLAQLSDELRSLNRVILFIKNFQNSFFATAMGFSMPIFYSMFKSALDNSDIKIIATMSSTLYEKLGADNEHILEDFGTIEVIEPTEKETQKILESTALYLSEFHNVDITKTMVNLIYKKAKELESDDKFPQKGVDLMDHCCTFVILKKSRIPESYKDMVDKRFDVLTQLQATLDEGKYEKALHLRKKIKNYDQKLSSKEEKIFIPEKRLKMTSDDVNEAVSVFREERDLDEDKAGLKNLSLLSEKIRARIVGQDEAVNSVAKSLVRSRLGLRSRKRPIGNFLFLGPTGVGKTEMAKVLADLFFGSKSLVRLDMSDFSEKHNVARLVGAPPGYVGYGEGGELTSKIETKPDSVVLFDEIEKAHPDVLNVLLQIMEEGELVDAKGTAYDFSRAVVILTSNLGTEILHNNEIGFEEKTISDKSVEGRLRNNLKKILKPELMNRFDEVIIFKRLQRDNQLRVLELLIREINTTIKAQNITLAVSKEVKEYLLEKGGSLEYGARALRRTLEKELVDSLAEYLLHHEKRPLSLCASISGGDINISAKKAKNC